MGFLKRFLAFFKRKTEPEDEEYYYEGYPDFDEPEPDWFGDQ